MRYGERIRNVYATLAAICCVAVALIVAPTADAAWTHWRGPTQTGASPETGLVSSWSPEGENVLWKGDAIVRSTPIIMDGRAYVMARVGKDITEQEQVVCFDVMTGKMLWEDRFNLYHTTVPFNRVGWTSPAGDPETNTIFVHGVGGVFNCYTADGEIVWSRSLTEDVGRISGYGGRTNTPIVDGDLVIFGFLSSSWGDQVAGRARFHAFDKRTGDTVWISTLPGRPLDTFYSVPVIADIDDQHLLITGSADGNVYALQANTGKIVWTFQFSKRGLNTSPVVDGYRVYIGHSEENIDTNAMGRVVCIDGRGSGDITKTNELWRIDGMGVGYTGLAVDKGVVYAIDNASNLHAINGESGKINWTHSLGTVGKGSPTIADGKIYAPEVNGRIHILEPRATEAVSLDHDEVKMPDGRLAEVYGSPAVAYGRVFIPTEAGLFCIGKEGLGPLESVGGFGRMISDGEAAQLQIIPAEVTIYPGESAKFYLRRFTANGVLIGDVKPESWTLNGISGTISDGEYSSDASAGPQAGTVSVKLRDLTATARVRVVPTLPYEEDFTNVAVDSSPNFWIGSIGKFMVVEQDGNRLLKKPPSDRGLDTAYVYIGKSDEKGYTVEADVMGAKPRRQMPDVGLIANRYTMTLKGNHQQLQIFSWASDLRMAKDMPFKWEPDVWYSMKMAVEYADGKALVHGKVWRKGDPEPDAWTLTAEDPLPNLEGSPGIYGSSVADIYYDNLRITKSE
ncbi:MAG: PQQ-binding-like beta-propeller repeat protein [Candidatus Poribacteria bacterium]|nr:PQQ-binding-like beta-propeller repeat protein [Candidatus Poribacteria bacterium]